MARSIRVARMMLAGKQVAVIQVPSFTVFNPREASRLLREYSEQLPEAEIVLLGLTGANKTYFGEQSLVAQLGKQPFERFQWNEISTG